VGSHHPQGLTFGPKDNTLCISKIIEIIKKFILGKNRWQKRKEEDEKTKSINEKFVMTALDNC
jgi:hypothetical protein